MLFTEFGYAEGWGGKWCQAAPSLYSQGSTLREVNYFTSCVTDVYQNTNFTVYLWVAFLPGVAQCTLGSNPSQACLFFKFQTSGTWCGGTYAGYLERHLTKPELMQVWPRRGSHTRKWGCGIWNYQAKQPRSQFAALSRCLCTYAEGQGRKMMPAGSFVPRVSMPPLIKALQNVWTVSPRVS